MKEAKVRAEITNLMSRLWLWPRTETDAVICPRCDAKIFPQAGRPDITFFNVKLAIEVKIFGDAGSWHKQSFAFSKIEGRQRAWIDMFLQDSDCDVGDNNVYLALGTRLGRAGSQQEPRLLWLIPWRTWISIENTIVNTYNRKSLPLDVFKGMKPKALALAEHTAIRLLNGLELEWSDGAWHLPKGHPFEAHLPMAYTDGERDLPAWREEWENTRERYLEQ